MTLAVHDNQFKPATNFPNPTDRLDTVLDGLIDQILRPIVIKSSTFDGRQLAVICADILGAPHTSGQWSMRDAYDWLEAATARYLMGHKRGEGAFLADDLGALMAISQSLPTQSRRTEDQVLLQQFSTPLPLAHLVVKAAQITVDDVVLEPSAGTGLLAAMGIALGQTRRVCDLRHTCPAELHVNELSRGRLALLNANSKHFSTITGHDAALLRSHLPDLRPSVVLMNPPFSSSHRGVFKHTGLKHIRTAYAMLRTGGRLVSIVPERENIPFWKDALALDGATVSCELSLPDDVYRKHGTSQQVRLIVIDKGVNDVRGVVQAKDCIEADTVLRLRLPERLPLSSTVPQQNTVQSHQSSAPAKTLKTPTLPKRLIKPLGQSLDLFAADMDATPIQIDPAKPNGAGAINGLYADYHLRRCHLPQGAKHPSQLVESRAMSEVSLPALAQGLSVSLTRRTLDTKALSEPQLEAVLYAASAHDRMLPGSFTLDPDTNHRTLVPDNMPDAFSYRMGFFIGDGTGVGKGREVSAIIQSNWLAGRTKAVWVSLSDKLIEDARRDWTDLGGLSSDIHHHSKIKSGASIKLPSGILFTTYATLRQASRQGKTSRLEQLLEWLGDDFDGAIMFDEAHAMGNMGDEKSKRGKTTASAQALAGLALQDRLPNARIVYVSATGATKPENLAYASRLGLWGTPEAPFTSRSQFMSAMASGGIAAMELVARDLKAQGLYMSRSLSFAGVEYDILDHALTGEQVATYDRYCDAWQIIHANIDKALEAVGIADEWGNVDSRAKAAAMSTFESTKQRFFAALLTGMKTPTLIKAIRADLADGNSCVIQLVSTGEALLTRRLETMTEDEKAHLDVDLTPRDAVCAFLEKSFPVIQHELVTDENDTQTAIPVHDEDGNPILNPDAVAARQALLEQICALPPVPTALDQLVASFGTSEIAEATGRSKRLIVKADGCQAIESRSASANVSETEAFMAGRKRILVFSEAGGTGRSYHASLTAVNQQRRIHYLLEPGWKAAAAIQGLGRTHRTNQASAPLFRPVTTDVKGERRFISTIAARLEALGALTRGERKTGGQNLFRASDNLDSGYARDALQQWYRLLRDGTLKAISLDDFCERTALKIVDETGGLLDALPPINRWLNRLLALPIALQNAIFVEYEALIEARVEAAIQAGTFDRGIETIHADTIELIDQALIRTDADTGAETYLSTIKTTTKVKPQDKDACLRVAGTDPIFVRNRKSGAVALLINASTIYDDEGRAVARVKLMRPKHDQTMTRDAYEGSNWFKCTRAVFDAGWDAEATALADQIDTDTFTMLSGLTLPLWQYVDQENMRVYRVSIENHPTLLGPILTAQACDQLLATLKVKDGGVSTPDTVWTAVMRLGRSIEARPCTFQSRRRFGEDRFEITGVPAGDLDVLKSFGCQIEIIQYKTVVFIPEDGDEHAVLGRVLGRYPLNSSV